MFLHFQLLASLIGGKTHCLSPFHLSQDMIEQLQNTDKSYIYPLFNTYDFFLLSLFFTGWQYTATRVPHFASCSSSNMNAALSESLKTKNTKNAAIKNTKYINWKIKRYKLKETRRGQVLLSCVNRTEAELEDATLSVDLLCRRNPNLKTQLVWPKRKCTMSVSALARSKVLVVTWTDLLSMLL